MSLAQRVQAVLPAVGPGGRYLIAYSGGLDSSVLLHLLRDTADVHAIHVNHGMQTQASAWQQHCQQYCEQFSVDLEICQVQPDVSQGGPEAAARDARYSAFAEIMQPGDVLLTAHHANDQAETFLLQALRGAGVRGLAAMPTEAAFAQGRIARPLLNISRPALLEYAQQHKLHWVEDPSNADPNLGRAYLRNHVSPCLQQRWPEFEQRLARAAAWCNDASVLAEELAVMDYAVCSGPVPECLLTSKVAALSARRQSNLIRYWIQQLALVPPDHRHVLQIQQIIAIEENAEAQVCWADTQIQRFQDWLYAMPSLQPLPDDYCADWDMQTPLTLPASCGQLVAENAALPTQVKVRFRSGGERLRLNGRKHTTSLKKTLNNAKVPGWVRTRLPLIFMDEEIVAVADYWLSEKLATNAGTSRPIIRWLDAPPGAELSRVVGNSAFS